MSQINFGASVQGHNVFAANQVAAGGQFKVFASAPESQPRRPLFVVPFPRNEDVVHRADACSKLKKHLPLFEDGYRSAALWGLGGSDKTQIALEFAYDRHRDPDCSVFWVHADTETTFRQDYQTIARKLGIPNTSADDNLLQTVRDRIEAEQRWFLVVDNADNLGLFGVGKLPDEVKTSLQDQIPNGPRGSVLWTSRDRRVGDSLVSPQRAVEVTGAINSEALVLLERAMNKEIQDQEMPDVTQLLKELESLPLAISQAGAYIKVTSTSISTYLRSLSRQKTRWRSLQGRHFDRFRRRNDPSIMQTWSISIDLIREEDGLAYEILHTFAYLDNERIPSELAGAIARRYNKSDEDEISEDDQSDAGSDDL